MGATRIVKIDPNVKSIRPYSFQESDFTDVVIEGDGELTLGEAAFARCRRLNRVVIKGRVHRIPAFAFSGCTALAHVHLGGVQSLGSEVFVDSPIEVLSLPTTLTEVAPGAFLGCKKLRVLDIRGHDLRSAGRILGCLYAVAHRDSRFILPGTSCTARLIYDFEIPVAYSQVPHKCSLNLSINSIARAAADLEESVTLPGFFLEGKINGLPRALLSDTHSEAALILSGAVPLDSLVLKAGSSSSPQIFRQYT